MNPIRHITVDAHDPHLLAAFWAQVTGFPLAGDTEPDDDEVLLEGPDGAPGLLFIRVGDDKLGKNRVHLDLQPAARRDDEVERLLTHGATIYEDHRQPGGLGWVTLRDPEGNEFCVERSAAERA